MPHRHRVPKLLLMLVLALAGMSTLAQVHTVEFDAHEEGEHCEICQLTGRINHAVPAPPSAPIPIFAPLPYQLTEARSGVAHRSLPAALARAPPACPQAI